MAGWAGVAVLVARLGMARGTTPVPTMVETLPPPTSFEAKCVTLTMVDSWGDGWDDASWSWTTELGAGLETGQFQSGGESGGGVSWMAHD